MNILKKIFKKKSNSQKEVENFYDKFSVKNFPEGKKQIELAANKVKLLSNNKLNKKESGELFLASIFLYQSFEKNEIEMIEYIIRKSNYKLVNNEANLIYLFIACYNTKFENASIEEQSRFVQFALESNQNDNDITNMKKRILNKIETTGCDSDEIPNGYGDFGYHITNPIPVKGIESNEIYLSRLRTSDNKKIKWRRTGSSEIDIIENPIDEYKIYNFKGDYLCNIYISPYHKRISKKAPKGFKILFE